MRSANQYPVPRTHPFKRMVAAVALIAVTLAGCTTESKIGNAESTTLPSATATVPQIAGLAAMNLVFVANPNGKDQILEQSLASPNVAPVALTGATCSSENPQLSPAGNQLVYYSDCAAGHNQIFTLDLSNHIQTQLTHDTTVQNYDPTYVLGADNELKIDWKQSDAAGNYGELLEQNANGSRRNLTPGLIKAKWEAWKPTGVSPTERIFGIRERQGDPGSDRIFSLNLVDGSIHQLTTGWFPAYSPEQNEVVFITKQDGHDVLATMNLDGTNRQVIVDMPGDTDDPSWGLGGNVVVYINNGRGKYDVYAYDVRTGVRVLLYDGNNHGRALAPILVPAAR